MTVRDAKSTLECWRSEERCGCAAGGKKGIESLGGGLDEARGGLSVFGLREQGKINCAAGTVHEGVGKGRMAGNFLQLSEKVDVVRGEYAQFEDGGGGRGFEQQGKSFAEAGPHGGARGVVEEGSGGATGFGGKTGEVASVAIEDFGRAGEGGAELPFARMKPVADGRERKLIRVAGFAGKYGGFWCGGGRLCKKMCAGRGDENEEERRGWRGRERASRIERAACSGA